MPYDALFISATDTGVGKTVVAAAIALSCRAAGKTVAALKPVETGVPPQPGECTDAEMLRRACDLSSTDEVCLYQLKEPLAPAVAADIEQTDIDIHRIVERFQHLRDQNDVVLVEGVGGLMVPIRWDYHVLHLIRDLAIPVLIVARPGLGTINHTVLTYQRLRDTGAEVFGIVLNGASSEPALAERTNPEAVRRMTGCNRVFVLPQCSSACAWAVAQALKPWVHDWFNTT